MACELIPWQSYVTGAVLEPLDNTAAHPDPLKCEEERHRLNVFYLPSGGHRRLRKMATFNKMFLNKRIVEYCENVHLLAIFGRPGVDINISCPGSCSIMICARPRLIWQQDSLMSMRTRARSESQSIGGLRTMFRML